MTTMESLNSIFSKVFDNESIQIRRETTARDVEGWDSLSHVNLILAVESSFGVRFSQRELLTMRHVGDLLDLVEAKLKSAKG